MNFRILRIWSPDSARIYQRFFLKSEILFGSDRSADILIPEVDELCARLDFSAREIHYLKGDHVTRLEPGELFQIGRKVFQWKEVKFKHSHLKWTLLSLVTGILLIAVTCSSRHWFRSPQSSGCSPKWQKFSTGSWQPERGDTEEEKFFEPLIEIKKSFQSAMKVKAWAKARAELDSIRGVVASQVEEGCIVPVEASHLEAQLSRALVTEYLKEGRSDIAAEEIQKFRKKFQSDQLDRLESRVLRSARKIYFEGYRLEEENAEKSADLIERAELTCKTLELPVQCYKTTTNGKKTSEER